MALAVQFDVLRVDLPVDRIRHSLKIWNHIEESLGDPVQTALLARNGFRVGVGQRSAWSAVRTIFEENGARCTRAAHTVQDGRELMIPLGYVADGDTYFVHRRGGNDPSILDVIVTPRSRQHRAQMKYVERGGQIVSVQDQEGMVFGELASAAALAPDQFLVIGTSAEAGGGYLLGSWWLSTRMDARDYEIVLCISARTVRAR